MIFLPFLALSGDVGESAFTWIEVVVGPEDKVDDETAGVQDATGLAAAAGSRSFLLWLQSLVISRVLPWSGLQGRVATWNKNVPLVIRLIVSRSRCVIG